MACCANLARLMPNGPSRRGGCGTVAKMLSNHNMPVPATVAFAGLLANFLDDLPPGPPRGLAEADGAAPGVSRRLLTPGGDGGVPPPRPPLFRPGSRLLPAE